MNIIKHTLIFSAAFIIFATPAKSDVTSFETVVADMDGITVGGVSYNQIRGNIALGASFGTDLEEAFDINVVSLGAGFILGDHEVGSFYVSASYSDSDITDGDGGMSVGWMKLGKTGTAYDFSVDDDETLSLKVGFDICNNRKFTLGVIDFMDDDMDMDPGIQIGFMSVF